MRYTRLEISGKNRRPVKILLFQFFVIIPMISIIIGYFISNLIIIPNIKATGEEGGASAQAGVFTVKKLEKMYFLQSGYFTKKEKADLLSKGIAQSGLRASVGSNKGKYRVITGLEESLEEVQKSLGNLKSLGYGGIVNTIDIQILDNSDIKELKLIKEYINIAANLIDYQDEKFKNSNENYNKTEIELQDGISQLQLVYDKLSGTDVKGEVKKEVGDLNEYFLQNCDQFLKSNVDGEKEKCEQSISNEVVALYDFYRMILQSYSN